MLPMSSDDLDYNSDLDVDETWIRKQQEKVCVFHSPVSSALFCDSSCFFVWLLGFAVHDGAFGSFM